MPASLFRNLALSVFLLTGLATGQPVTTAGFQNTARSEAPGTLLSHPVTNGSEPIGRTTTINYLNGWVIVGAEQPGSREGSDWQVRVYDISDPTNLIRRMPSDFGLSYPNNSWISGNHGWNAHGTAQYNNLLLPDPIRVEGFGGLVERAGSNGVPWITNLPLWYNRSSQAGPWDATMLWYGTDDSDIEISRMSVGQGGTSQRRVLATFDHVGPYGGGDWHPMFYGDLLIMARSGGAGMDGVVVYRLHYQNMDDADPANDRIVPQVAGTLQGGFQGYWPNLFSDGTGLYVIGSTTDILIAADISSATMPGGDVHLQTVASLTVPSFTNASYPVYQDHFGFIHNRKIDMTRFVAGDANPIVLTLNEANPPRPAGAPTLPNGAITAVNTSQMSLPLGNLWLTGGYPIPGFNQGLGVWVHQQDADTTPPRVSHHIPQAGRTNYPRHAPLSFLVHEHPRNGGPRNGIDFTVRAVGAGGTLGTPVSGFLIHDFSGNMTFTPDAPLAAETTFQVDFHSDPAQGIGFSDAAGNYIEPYSYRFSTGGGLNAPTPPAITALAATNHHPAPGESVTVSATATGTGPLEYRFNFDGSWSVWGSVSSSSHTYTITGRPRVLVQVSDASGNIVTDSLRLLVISTLPAGPVPTQSGTLAVGEDPGGRRVWSVNPDANTVSVIDAVSGAKVAEHAAGTSPRGIARDANGRYWVTCHGSDEIRVLNADGSVHATVPLAYGSAPFGIAASPDGSLIYATMYGSGQIQRFSSSSPLATPLTQSTFPTPRAIAISANGSRIFVTRFISPELQAEIGEFSASLAPVRTITLAASSTFDGGDRSSGVPNYLAGAAVSPDGSRLSVVSKQDNTQRGTLFGVGDLTHETTSRAVISFVDLVTNAEISHSRRDFDNSDSPSAVTYTPLGDTILIAHQGNNRVVGIDAFNLAPLSIQPMGGSTETSPAVIALDVSTGVAPQGILIDAVSGRLFSQDFMGRSVTVRDAAPLLDQNQTSLPLIATTPTVASELLSPQVLQGKRIFYNAADPRMSADSYISCATCHVDGGQDGRVWDFTGRGEGLRRTADLRGRDGIGHGMVHWSGNFDEIQDFEHDIRGPFGGTGFLNLSPEQFSALHPDPRTGKTGLSADLDALAAYVTSLSASHVPRSPHRNPNGTLTASAIRGQSVFSSQSCTTCHSGDRFTNSTLNNVGSLSSLSGSRLGGNLPGIDTPTLHGLHASRSYLHHGQAETLADVFSYVGGTIQQANTGQFFGGGVNAFPDDPVQGGGGFVRGLVGGNAVTIGGTEGVSGVRFNNVDGGTGGNARIALRYVRQYGGGTALLRINGVQQSLTVLRQFPDNGWHISGWRWIVVEAVLNAGATNTIEVLRGNGDLTLNSMLVSNADALVIAQPHRVVQSLQTADRDDLMAYIRQIDGRDASGVPFPPAAPPSLSQPVVIQQPHDRVFAEGNRLHFSVAVGGTGPFTYVWRRNGQQIGGNSAELIIPSVTTSASGYYVCTITNNVGEAATTPASVTVNSSLAIITSSLPAGTDGVPYVFQLQSEGGISAATWTLVSGSLPSGLTFSATGALSGRPMTSARSVIVVRVEDLSGSANRALELNISPVGGFVNDPDLVLHYTFDEMSGTRIWDSAAAGNNHATDVSGAHWIADGRFGGAYGPSATSDWMQNFTPANQADLNFNPRGDAFTISLWCRTTVATHYHTLIGKDGGDPYTVQQRIWTVNPANALQAVNGNQYGGQIVTSPAINDGQWHLVTMVNFNDAGTWRTRLHYDNGSVSTTLNAGSGGMTTALLRVGGLSAGWNGWAGQIDDLRIYRRALSQAEISAMYAAPAPQTYATWAAVNLTPSQLANPLLNGMLHDADGDGVVNMLEYALGQSNPHPLSIDLIDSPGGKSARLTARRNTLARGITLSIERSLNLITWNAVAESINGTAFSGSSSIQETGSPLGEVQLLDPVGQTPAFYRIRASSW